MVDAQRLAAAMEEAGLDAIVAASPENVLYLSGVNILTQRLIPDRLAICVWPRDASPAIIVCIHEEPQTRKDSRIQNIYAYFEFEETPIEALDRVLRSMGLESAKVGLEVRFLAALYYEELKTRLPNVTFAAADTLLSGLRAVKTPEEVALLEAVALLTDRAVGAAFESAHPGDSERAVAITICRRLLEEGADELRPLMLGAGPNAAFIHQLPTAYRLAPGDICRLDVGALKKGYQSDLARIAVVAPSSAGQRDAYQKLWAVHEEVIAAIRPGITGAEVYATYSRAAGARGIFRRRPHIGHGLGIGMHEAPLLTPSSGQRLEAGMVLCVEYTHLRAPELYHIEDTVHVTPDGCRVISRSSDWSALREIG